MNDFVTNIVASCIVVDAVVCYYRDLAYKTAVGFWLDCWHETVTPIGPKALNKVETRHKLTRQDQGEHRLVRIN